MSSGRPCTICTDPVRKDFVARRVAEGYTANRIEAASRTPEAAEMGIEPMKRETVARHVTNHLVGPGVAPIGATASHMQELAQATAKVALGQADPNDVARLVRDQAAELLRTGALRITTQHGLQAQQMMDRRDEKKADRELAYNIAAMMLSHSPPPTIIEGEVIDVTDQQEA